MGGVISKRAGCYGDTRRERIKHEFPSVFVIAAREVVFDETYRKQHGCRTSVLRTVTYASVNILGVIVGCPQCGCC